MTLTTIHTVQKACGHTVRANSSRAERETAINSSCKQCKRERDDRIIQDPKVTRYITVIKSKPKSGGELSDNTKQHIGFSLNSFIQYVGVNSPSELLELHLKTKDEHLIEDKLEEFAQLRKINKLYSQFVRGFFRANRIPLNVYIDNHTVDTRPPPSEDRLNHIHEQASLEQKALMSLQADSGERIRAVALTKIEELPDLNQQQDLHIIIFDERRTKIHKHHISYYSEQTAELIRQYIQDNSIRQGTPLFPNYRNTWRLITDYSKSTGTYLKSHHLRKRFVHIAERTPMPIAEIDYLMGDAKKGVHCAEAYSYTLQDELAGEYRTFLLPRITIGVTIAPPHSTPSDSSLKLSVSNRERELRQDLRRANKTIDSLNRTIKILSTQLS